MNYKDIKRKLDFGYPLPVIKGKILLKLGNLEIVWWGFSQIHIWRWHGTHIDLGVISIYGCKSSLWKILAFLIKPLRKRFHNNYIQKITKKN